MRKLLLATALIAFMPLSVAAAPQDNAQNNGILVTAPEFSVVRWSGAVGQQLTRNLRTSAWPLWMRDNVPSRAIAAISFRCDAQGNPTDARIVRRSGSPIFDQMAMSAVKRLSALRPLPTGVSADPSIRANLIFVQTQADLDDAQAQLAREAARDRLAARASNTELVLNGRAFVERAGNR